MEKKLKYISYLAGESCKRFDGGKKYYSTGAVSGDGEYELVSYDNRPSRANVMVKENDIILAKMSNTNKTTIVDKEMEKNIYSTGFAVLNSHKLNNKYFYYLLSDYEFNEKKNLYSNGTTQVAINDLSLLNIKVNYVDNIICQEKIASFLDKKIKLIDGIILDLNNEIEILGNYKESLIIETVCRGLDKKCKLKDSKIQWIGSVPEHWNVRRIKHCFINDKFGIKVGPFGSSLTDCVVGSNEGSYKIYGQANLIQRDFSIGDNYVSEKDYYRLKSYEVIPEDIVVSMMGTIGKCRVVPYNIEKGIMDSHLIKIRVNKDIMDPKYFEYQYEGKNIYEQLLYYSNGSIMNGLNSSIVKNVYFVYPPIEEQKKIVEYLDDKCSNIDNIIKEKQQQVNKIEKYKESLIYEYVTGKKALKGVEELYG